LEKARKIQIVLLFYQYALTFPLFHDGSAPMTSITRFPIKNLHHSRKFSKTPIFVEVRQYAPDEVGDQGI
jgi:hypothetical protein